MIDLPPDRVISELIDYQMRWLGGLDTLQDSADIKAGCSPCQQVFHYKGSTLYHFTPQVESPHPTPLLISYALVNTPWIADLEDGRSLIQGLLQQGLDIYMIDWGDPTPADRYIGLHDYINDRMDQCIDYVRKAHALQQIDLLGICQGGTLALCYIALHQDKIRNLVTTVTPVDFQTPNDQLSALCQHLDIDLLVDTLGNVPSSMLNASFLSLRPFDLSVRKYVDMVDLFADETRLQNFLRMEKWIFNGPALAGQAFREFIKQFYQQNALIRAAACIGGQTINLQHIRLPVLNVYALHDHLVPPESSIALKQHIGSTDYSTLEFPGGHIGLYVSKKAGKMIAPAVAEWLRARH